MNSTYYPDMVLGSEPIKSWKYIPEKETDTKI